MYNRYIGNTGKVYRVSEPSDRVRDKPPPRRNEPPRVEQPDNLQARGRRKLLPSLFGGGGGAKFLETSLPFGLELSDLVILALLFFLFIESGDEEFLIILGFLAYSIFKDHKG